MNAPAPIPLLIRAAAPADEARIEAFLADHPEATPFHRPAWSRAVESATGHRSHYLVADQGGAIVGLLPLSEIRSRLFGAALVSAGFAVEGGILALGEAAAAALAGEAERLADRVGCPGIELRGGPVPDGWRAVSGSHAGFVRDLPGDEETILKAIPRKQRAEVRRAMGFGLTADIDADTATHHRVYAESVRNLGTPVFPAALFRAVLEEFGTDADILTVRRDGEALASVLSLYFKNCVYPYWGGGTFAARAARANELMYFALMRHAAARGCTRFDFGRSKTGSGAFAYKKNWGFEPRPLVYAHWGAARETSPLSPRYRLQIALWKKLPLPVANRLGPLIARGLG
ncbi:MAG: FemAB family XrtA/PEP-CTERM system-associated protein [Allosphingosinicella sp.]|uniref:FemAB family XrtA/PEP-CTERM system-associated protein n=1 Tax=Allosphingosinicella sp. TaxID=2823234 RepID=UPI0039504DE0